MKRLPPKWRERIELVIEDGKHDCGFVLKFKKGKTPAGCKNHIGSLEVSYTNGYWFVESIFVNPKFRGKRLGMLLYETAIKHLGHLVTQYHNASKNAQSCWGSIVKRYEWEVDFFGGYLQVFDKKLLKSRKKSRETLFSYKKL
jgi:GNAT superfamily N-acetyltransferase